jgi:hypothetical protein
LASTKNQFREMRNNQKPKAVATQDLARLRTSPRLIAFAALPQLRVPTAGFFKKGRNGASKSAIDGVNKFCTISLDSGY